MICGGGAIGASIAYFLSRRGVETIVIERTGLACAASGKSGGFLALDWCDGTPLQSLARRSFALHAPLPEETGGDWGAIQEWVVDLVRHTASLGATTKRQILPMDRRLDVKLIAAEIAAIVSDGREDPRVKRRGPERVEIMAGKVIPTTNRQTTSSRRKRFVAEVGRLLAASGWCRASAGGHLIFERPSMGAPDLLP
jgi:hypothetical protein